MRGVGIIRAFTHGRMTRLSPFVFASVLAVTAAACASSPTAPIDTTVTLAPNKTSVIGNLSVKFIGVTIDTRCPANALCIQAGDAYIALEATVASTRRSFELQVLNPTRREVDFRDYTIAVESLSPHPFLPMPIEPEDYRVTLRVTR
jgi:hypothetical protein